MLKQFKIPIIAPTCFGSRRNHHHGAISCFAKTTIMILLWRGQCYGGIFLRETKYVGAIVGILIVFNTHVIL